MMEPLKLSAVDILSKSPLFCEIVKKVEQLAKLNRVVLQNLAPELSAHCRVANVREGILILSTASSAMGYQLRFTEIELLSALRAIPAWCHLKSIKIQVRPPHNIPTPLSPASLPRPNLSKSTAKILKMTAEDLNPSPLQEALLRLSSRASKADQG